jgi:hypothetical protein
MSSFAIDLFASDHRLAFLASFFSTLEPSSPISRHFAQHANLLFTAALEVVFNSATACNIDSSHYHLYRKLLSESAAIAASCSRFSTHSLSSENIITTLRLFYQVIQGLDMQTVNVIDITNNEEDYRLVINFLQFFVFCLDPQLTDIASILNTIYSLYIKKKSSLSEYILDTLLHTLSESLIILFTIMLDRPRDTRDPIRIAIFNCLKLLIERDLTTSIDPEDNLGVKTVSIFLSEVSFRLYTKSGTSTTAGSITIHSENERTLKLKEIIERASGEILSSSGLDVKKWQLVKEIAYKTALKRF